MPRRRGSQPGNVTPAQVEATEGESVSVFETLTAEEWAEEAASTAGKGQYREILTQFVDSGQRYARISTAPGQPMAGKKAQSISTSLKTARDAKTAPAAFASVKISSKGGNKEGGAPGVVYLENTAVEA